VGLAFWVNCGLLLLSTLVVVFLQIIWVPGIGYNNFYVPDGYTYFNFLQDEFQSPDYFTVVFDATPNPGIYILYYPFFLVSDKLCLVPNLIIMVFSLLLCVRIFKPIKPAAVWLASLAVTLNPYTLLGITGPNKETPLILAILVFVYGIVTRRSIVTLCSILFAASMRPAIGIILAGCWLVIACMRKSFKFAVVALFVPVAVATFSQFLYDPRQISESFFAAYDAADTPLNYYSLGLPEFNNPIGALFAYLFRCLGNAFSTMVRFSAMTERSEVALLGAGYGVYGAALAFGMLNLLFVAREQMVVGVPERSGSGKAILSNSILHSTPVKAMVLIVLFVWLSQSINSFIHSRYLMPILPILFGLLGVSATPKRLAMIAGCLILGAGFYFTAQTILGFNDTPPVTHEYYKPEYLP
jgi:hypothetical protein